MWLLEKLYGISVDRAEASGMGGRDLLMWTPFVKADSVRVELMEEAAPDAWSSIWSGLICLQFRRQAVNVDGQFRIDACYVHLGKGFRAGLSNGRVSAGHIAHVHARASLGLEDFKISSSLSSSEPCCSAAGARSSTDHAHGCVDNVRDKAQP